jgi:outer membrane cobalamin receptor
MLLPCVSAAKDAQLDKIEITGNNSTTNSALNQQFYSRDYFIGKFQNLSDVLQLTPGVQVRRSSYGNPPKISIRGSTHKQVTFIIDGQVINTAQSGSFNVDLIPLQQIESIEVLQSGNSSGVQAIGGIISITTISPKNKNNVSLSTGSFSHKEIGVSLSGKVHGNLIISANHASNSGDYEYPVPSPIDDPNDKNRIEKIKNNQYKNKSILLKWNNHKLENLNVDLKTQYIDTEKNIPNFQINDNGNNAFLEEKKWSHDIGLKWDISKHLSSQTNAGISKSDEKYEDINGILSYTPTSNKYENENYYIFENISLLKNNSIYDISLNSNTEKYSEDKTLILDSKKCTSSISVCDAIAKQNKTSITLSYSYIASGFDTSININNTWLNRVQDNRTGVSSENEINQEFNTWGLYYQSRNWPIGNFRLDIGKGIRLPSLFELFGDRGLLKSNPSILPESSINRSLEFTFNEVKIDSTNINIATSIYTKEISDAIVPIYSGFVGSYSNTSSADIIGYQVNIAINKENIGFSLQKTVQDSSTESLIKSFNDKKLAGIYHEKTIYSMIWNINKYSNISLTHQTESGLYIDMANLNPSIKNQTTGFKFSYAIENSSFNLSVNNLFDNEYYDQNNRPVIDRNISLNIQHQF